MNTASVLTAVAVGVVAAALVALTRRSAGRVADRLGPYRPDGGAASASVGAAWSPRPAGDGAAGLFGALTHGLVAMVRPLVGGQSESRAAARLRAAGLDTDDLEGFRVRQFGRAALIAAVGVVFGALMLHSAAMTLLLGVCGGAVGLTREPARLARVAAARRTRMRLELVTIDQLLAVHVRAGAGPVQAVTHVVDRGRGVVVDELRGILGSIRAGRSEAEAFRHAATTTCEPHAARTYRLFALAAERGADLGTALRALSDDLRDVRRDDLRRESTRRRAAMLVPTIAVLAPIMLLFVIAPLPSIVLGGR